MVEQINTAADRSQAMIEYFSKFKGNAFYSRINSIASEHSMPLDLRVKAALHALQHAKNDDKIM